MVTNLLPIPWHSKEAVSAEYVEGIALTGEWRYFKIGVCLYRERCD